MLRGVIGVRVIEEIFRCGYQLRIIQVQAQRRMPGGEAIASTSLSSETGMAVVVEDSDLANLFQQAIVCLLISGRHVRTGLPHSKRGERLRRVIGIQSFSTVAELFNPTRAKYTSRAL